MSDKNGSLNYPCVSFSMNEREKKFMKINKQS